MAGRQAQAVVPAGLLDDIISKSKPLVQGALKAADAAAPIIDKAVGICRATYKKLEPYHPEDFLPLICGLVLIFYGGVFPVTIAAVEAFRICGWDRTRNSITLLYRQYKVALEASKKDNVVDANQDGVPDVQQIDTRALASRKIALFMRCTDPNAMHEGLQGVTAGCSAVVATLRVHFAQTLTLGVSLGDVFTRTADQVLRPALEKAVPLEYHKWIGMGISYACRSLAVTIAWWCTRIISALHSATRGAQLVLYGVTLVAARHHIQIPVDLSATNPLYPIVCGTVGGAGLYFQLVRGFGLPFPFNLLLLPVRFVEWLLWYFLAYGN